MVTKTQARRKQDIKSKLMAAIAMLLVSSIMMVSSTYAWFTLSTAPEVTGISTAVGANGNLEMALLPTDGLTTEESDFGITSGQGDSTKAINLRNVTWGNLVDLGENIYYGLNKISLYPAALNITADGKLDGASYLETPGYGADGRVSELLANAVNGTYSGGEGGSFEQNDDTGVRVVGTASSMTDRQLDYRNYRSSAANNMGRAKTLATESLKNNGNVLANIVVKKALSGDSATYTSEEIDALGAIVKSLLGEGETKGVLEYIEEAYRDYIIAYAASSLAQKTGENDDTGMTDLEFSNLKTDILAKDSVYEVITDYSNYLPEGIGNYTGKLSDTRAAVQGAYDGIYGNDSGVTGLVDSEKYTNNNFAWGDISGIITKLADPNKMKVSGLTVDQINDDMGTIVNAVAAGNLEVSIASEGGVYADVADHCGNYNAAIEIMIDHDLIGSTAVKATMLTESSVDPSYLSIIGAAVQAAEAPDGGESAGNLPITDYYAYVIDLAFRTNATASNLLLQTTPKDRIYSDNATDAETAGHGSTMTFTANGIDLDSMKNLMECINIVFFNTETLDILKTAKLDAANAVTGAGGNSLTANIYIVGEATTSYTEATAEQKTDATTTLYTKDGEDNYTAVADKTSLDGSTTYYVAGPGTPGFITEEGKGVITGLDQNQAKAVSVLVYLDGQTVTNADVAATGSTSMSGTMNLQFSSSAELDPMDYTPLQSQTGSTTGGQTGGDTTGGTTTGGETTDEGEGTT